MPTWKLTLEYDGTRYHGWQSQKNADRTVQGVLGRAARELLGEDATVGGAGRTDAGVHALAQIAHLKARATLSPLEVERGLNDRLPFDVNVLAAEEAPASFHARHDAASRRYLYRISKRRTAFDKRLVWWIKDRLEAVPMRAAAELFVGRHDFSAFCENAGGQESTVVVVAESVLADAGKELHFRIEASHFLWKMVRRLVGTLVEVGRGNLTPENVRRLLEEGTPGATAAWTAPPSGLFVEEVRYGTAARAGFPVSRRERERTSGLPRRSEPERERTSGLPRRSEPERERTASPPRRSDPERERTSGPPRRAESEHGRGAVPSRIHGPQSDRPAAAPGRPAFNPRPAASPSRRSAPSAEGAPRPPRNTNLRPTGPASARRPDPGRERTPRPPWKPPPRNR